jgi:hypothetical protein
MLLLLLLLLLLHAKLQTPTVDNSAVDQLMTKTS